ncbi:MAG TPA: helix-turn-helix transcriptional regulator [Solirubrobacteraceae bacterium]|jgi:AraC-like DNA-binding protein|nr:helix-turn-helix transcriptional regulator [Solirubrobacteraceae bacterium]
MASLPTAGIAAAPRGARAASAAARIVAVRDVIALMVAHPERPLELAEMGRAAHLSPWYFNRVFREITGLPPRRFQTALRMAAAKQLLLTTDVSVSDVCLEVGYRSLGTFVTHFRELVGVSPRALRRLADEPVARIAQAPAPARTRSGAGAGAEGAAVVGTLSAPDDEPRVIFLGLFEHPSPQGVPRACTMLSGAGAYRLGPVPAGRHHVAAAALPLSHDVRSYLLPDDDAVLVARADGSVAPRTGGTLVRHLRLRPKRAIDPPILLVPHVLIADAR